MGKFLPSNIRPRPPLHFLCMSGDPLEFRLLAIQEALASGEDPNELGGSSYTGIARPLHYAISDCIQHDQVQLQQNLPVIKLLLKAGADPRLPDKDGQSPIEELEAWFREYHKGGYLKWEPEFLELKPFFEAALETLKEAALALDTQDAASTAQAASQAAPASSSRSWFGSLRLW
jgi:hypothetical protein